MSDAGLSILCVFESSASRAAGGEAAGTADGQTALSEAKLINMPTSGCIYFAVDYDAQPSDFAKIEAYLKAAKAQIGNYKIGVYGGYYVIEAMAKKGICDCYWQTYAWSGGKLSSYTNVYQHLNGQSVSGISPVDLNKSYGNEGFWNYNKPKTWEDYVLAVFSNPDEWKAAITLAVNNATVNTGLEVMGIFKYFGTLIEKTGELQYTGTKTWKQIITTFSSNPNEWETAINAAVGAAAADGNLGTLEIFKFIPDLIVKIYENNK